MQNSQMYQIIVSKLGFDPKDYKSDANIRPTEDDSKPNPFDKLTLEELLFVRSYLKE